MCVCMCVYVYVCVCMCVYVCVYVCVCVFPSIAIRFYVGIILTIAVAVQTQ
jgi:hypothetical protein